jgi:hypothetical protein
MGLGVPSYISLPSTGGVGSTFSPWQSVDDFRDPINLSISVINSSASALSSGAFLQFTLDDPFGLPAHPLAPPGQGPQGPSSAPFFTTFSASAFTGNLNGGSSSAPITTFPFVGSITVPVRAWRIANSSSAGTVIATALQAGPR